MTTYTYFNSADFPNGIIAGQLFHEIELDTGITKRLMNVKDITGDNVEISFENALSVGEKTILDGLVSTHVIDIDDIADVRNINNELILKTIEGDIKYFPNGTKKITVSNTDQSDFTTIKAALDSIIPGNNTTVFVTSGTYVETNPITIPDGVVLKSTGGQNNTMIVATNPNDIIINIGKSAAINGFKIVGAAGPSGIGINWDGSGAPGGLSMVEMCWIIDCTVGIKARNAPNTLYCFRSLITNSALGSNMAVDIADAALFNCNSMAIIGNPAAKFDTAFKCAGIGTSLYALSVRIDYCNKGLHLDDDGECILSNVIIWYNDTAICVGSIGSSCRLQANGVSVNNSTTNDLLLLPTDADIFISVSRMDEDKIYNPNNIKMNAFIRTSNIHKKTQTMIGELDIGKPDNPSKLIVGEGKYNFTTTILSNNNLEIGTWVDNTSFSSSYNTTPFDLFQSTAIGSCAYIGSDYPILGFKANIGITSDFISGDPIPEYWNGTNWIIFTCMHTDSMAPYYSITDPYLNVVGKQQIRFGLTTNTPFVKKTLNGINKYWIRLRITTSPSIIPTLLYFKLHNNSAKFNSGGYLEYFGNSRPIKKLAWEINVTKPANSSPGNQDIYISDNLNVGRIENKFISTGIDRLGLNAFLPEDLDNSFPLKLMWSIIVNNDSSGDIYWEIRWNKTKDNDSIYMSTFNAPTTSPNEQVQYVTTNITANSKEKQITVTTKLNINNFVARPKTGNREIMWLTLARNGNHISDTFTNNVAIVQMSVYYVSWCDGGHLLSF